MRTTDLARQLWPLLRPEVENVVRNGASSRGGSGGGALSAHSLSGGYHSGTLDGDQAPQFVLLDGSRPLTGNWAFDAGVTIDGMDPSVHIADPDAHHVRATSGVGLNITGQQLSVNQAYAFSWTAKHIFYASDFHAKEITLLGQLAGGSDGYVAGRMDVAGDLSAATVDALLWSNEFTVGGSINTFYPIIFVDNDWGAGAADLEITRGDAHRDAPSLGSMIARFRFHNPRLGHGSNFAELYQYEYSGSQSQGFIADYTANAYSNEFIVWLRGGNVTYRYRSRANRVRPSDVTAADIKGSFNSTQHDSRTTVATGVIQGTQMAADPATGVQNITPTAGSGYGLTDSLFVADYLVVGKVNPGVQYNGSIYDWVKLDVGGGAHISGTIQHPNWFAGETNWGMTGAGELDLRLMTVDTLIAKAFVTQLQEALLGGMVSGKSRAILAEDFYVPYQGPVIAVDAAADWFEVTGDQAQVIVVGNTFVVVLSTGNDGAYTVESVAYQSGSNRTRITVTGDITDSTADGTIQFNASLTVEDIPGYQDSGVFQAGDWVNMRMREIATGLVIASVFGTVDNYTDLSGDDEGNQRWTFTRKDTTDAIAGFRMRAGLVVVDYGQSGDGTWELVTIDMTTPGDPSTSVAPYAQTVTWTGTPATRTIRTRSGNLRGIHSGYGDGFWAGRGTAIATPAIVLSSTLADIYQVALTLYDGVTPTIKVNPAGPSLAIGNPLPTNFSTGNGIWFGKDGAAYKARIGNPAGNRFTYDSVTGLAEFVGDGVVSIQNGVLSADAVNGVILTGATVRTSSGNPRIEMTSAKLRGLDSSGVEQWSADTSIDSKLLAGAGAVSLDVSGISIEVADDIEDPTRQIKWLYNGDVVGLLTFAYQPDADFAWGVARSQGIDADDIANFDIGAGSSTLISLWRYPTGGYGGGALEEIHMHAETTQIYGNLLIDAGAGGWGSDLSVVGSGTFGDYVYLDTGLQKKLGGSYYVTRSFVPLTTPLLSTAWDGDAKTTADTGVIDLSAVFGVPANVKAVLCRFAIRSTATGIITFLGPDTTYGPIVIHTMVANQWHFDNGIVPCNADGDIAFYTANNVETIIEIFGYWL